MKKPWSLPWQNEFDLTECYEENFKPLDLTPLKNDRNYKFYELQNELIRERNPDQFTKILWQMLPFIQGVARSIAKKRICLGVKKIPDFDFKCEEVALVVLEHYRQFPYYRAEKLENVVWHKVTQVFLNQNLMINERSNSIDVMAEKGIEPGYDPCNEVIDRIENENKRSNGSDYELEIVV